MEQKTPNPSKVAYYIFRATITVHGVVLHAKDYGKKAFRIPVYR